MTVKNVQDDVERILHDVQPLPRPRAWPALVVLVGAPGSGKAPVATALQRRTPVVVLRADDIRRALVAEPDHSFAESQRITRALRSATAALLSQQISVVLDDANLTEWERAPLYSLAEQHRARLIIVEVVAPMDVVLQRLRDERADGPPSRRGSGEDVYHGMAGRSEPITREHYTVDTAQDIAQFVDALAMDLDEG